MVFAHYPVTSRSVYCVGFDPSGKKLVSGSSDETVKVWSVGSSGTFECESTLNVDAGFRGVQSVSFSPKDNVIAAGCYNGKIHLVDAVAGEVKSTLTGHTRYVPVPALLVLKIVCSLSSDAQFCPWRLLRQDGQEAGFVQRGPNYHGVGRDNRGAHWLDPDRAFRQVSLLPLCSCRSFLHVAHAD